MYVFKCSECGKFFESIEQLKARDWICYKCCPRAYGNPESDREKTNMEAVTELFGNIFGLKREGE